MSRRTRLQEPRKRRKPAEVEVRKVDPGTDWTLDQARDLKRQGYTTEHIEEVTGWARRFVEAPSSRHSRSST